MGLSDGVVSELATYWEVLPGHEDELRAATQRFADTLRAVPREKNLHTGLRDQRHVIFDNGTRLMWATTFENDWDPYFEDFVQIGIQHFLDWMEHTAQYTNVAEWLEGVRRGGQVPPGQPRSRGADEAQRWRPQGDRPVGAEPGDRLLQQPARGARCRRSSRASG